MKTIIKFGLGIVVALFIFAWMLDDEETTEPEMKPAQVDEKAEENKKPEQTKTAEDKPRKPKTKSDTKKTAVWADGKVARIGAAEYRRRVINYTSSDAKYLGEGPCVVDLYASWCAPCMALAPHVEELAKKYKGKVQFFKIDVDDNGALTSHYNIRSIPTLFLFDKDGKMEKIVGAPTNLAEKVERLAR